MVSNPAPSTATDTASSANEKIALIESGPADAAITLVLAHGAGAPMDSDFMKEIAQIVAGYGHRVVRFEFPYMAKRRIDGKKRGPDRAPVLIATWQDVVHQARTSNPQGRIVIGGKSMGGRIASMVADDLGVTGLVCLGYPFHPVGKPDKLRTDHLKGLETPTLIAQGTRDPFGTQDEVAGFDLSEAISFHWVADGNHDFVPRKKSGETPTGNLAAAGKAIDRFLRGLTR
jgi:predicted alpha/beta-hydrolase family hydrolase